MHKDVFNPTQDKAQAIFEANQWAFGRNFYDETDIYER